MILFLLWLLARPRQRLRCGRLSSLVSTYLGYSRGVEGPAPGPIIPLRDRVMASGFRLSPNQLPAACSVQYHIYYRVVVLPATRYVTKL